MQKKVVGIIAGVAAAHAVLLIGLMAGGGCRQPEILGPHTYNNGPEFSDPETQEVKAQKPAAVTPPEVKQTEYVPPVVQPKPVKKPAVVTPPAKKDAPKPAKKPAGGIYKVKKGDSLSKIAGMYGIRMQVLADYNNIPKEKYGKLQIGQELRIPEGGKYTPPRKNVTKKTEKAPAPADANGVYTVKSGDSLSKIAGRYGIKVKALADFNKIPKEKYGKLQIGQKLYIPGKAQAPVQKSDEQAPKKQDAEAAKNDSGINDIEPADDGGEGAPDVDANVSDDDSLEAFLISEDISIEDYCRRLNIPVEELRKHNPNLPQDGILKKDTYVKISVL